MYLPKWSTLINKDKANTGWLEICYICWIIFLIYGCDICIFWNTLNLSFNQNMIYTDGQFIKGKIRFLQYITGISAAAALFVGGSQTIGFISFVETSLNKKLPLTVLIVNCYDTLMIPKFTNYVTNINQSFTDLSIKMFI